jgi:hypothetical protein
VNIKTQVAAVTAAVAVPTSLSATVARAEGAELAHENGAPPATSSLAPGEDVVNADGAQEDPNHRMTEVARAYQNGLINGKAMQKQADAKERQANVPPLPPEMQGGQDATVTPVRMPEVAPRRVPSQPRYTQYESPPLPPRQTLTYVLPEAPDDPTPAYAQPVYQQPMYQVPVYVQPAYTPPPPPPPLVQYVPVHGQPAYAPVQAVVQPAIMVPAPIPFPVYRSGGWGCGARGGWR